MKEISYLHILSQFALLPKSENMASISDALTDVLNGSPGSD